MPQQVLFYRQCPAVLLMTTPSERISVERLLPMLQWLEIHEMETAG